MFRAIGNLWRSAGVPVFFAGPIPAPLVELRCVVTRRAGAGYGQDCYRDTCITVSAQLRELRYWTWICASAVYVVTRDLRWEYVRTNTTHLKPAKSQDFREFESHPLRLSTR